jgi:hypothetical protein
MIVSISSASLFGRERLVGGVAVVIMWFDFLWVGFYWGCIGVPNIGVETEKES